MTPPKTSKKQQTQDAAPTPALSQVRERIDGIDRQIQALIAERAGFALQVGKAKGKLAAAVDYYRPEREAQVLRRVVDRTDGPLSDVEMVRLFREIMSACLAQQQPLKIGYLGPQGTFSEQAVRKHFGHSSHGMPMGSIEEVFQEVGTDHHSGLVGLEARPEGGVEQVANLVHTISLLHIAMDNHESGSFERRQEAIVDVWLGLLAEIGSR